MGPDVAATLGDLRDAVLARLVEIRGSIDGVYLRLPEASARSQFEALLDQLIEAFRLGDRVGFEDYASRWAAMRYGEGFGAETVLNTLAALGDVVARVALQRLPVGTQAAELAGAAIDASAAVTRLAALGVAEELAERTAQLAALRTGSR